MRKTLIFLTLFLVLTKIILVTAIFFFPKITTESIVDVDSQELIALTNQHREDLGLSQLSPNARLTQAAVNKARDLLTHQYFNHTSPEGKRFSDWIKDVDYKYFYVGENLAIDFDSNQDIFNAWLNSPTHRANIEKSQYQEVGMAVLEGKYKNHSTVVVVQLFGTRILPVNESMPDIPFSNWADNYFYQPTWWQKISSLEVLDNLNNWNNYALLVFLGLLLITYKPYIKRNHKSANTPIVSRYQTKIFKE